MMTPFNDRSITGSTGVVQCSGGLDSLGWVYAIGRIRPYFPSRDIERELLQLMPDPPPAGITTEDQRLQYVMQKNPFFAREVGWLFLVEDVETYVLSPRSSTELAAMIATIVPAQGAQMVTYDVIIGAQDPAVGAGGELPGVTVNHTYPLTLTDLANSVTAALRQQGVTNLPTTAQITEIFDDMLQLADNTGDADEHRALNYVSVCYPNVYVAQYAPPQAQATTYFAAVETRRSPLGGTRSIIDVILRYENKSTGLVSRFYTAVDVSGQFPFLVTKLQPYFER